MEEEIKVLVARFWNDVAGLPWQDKGWVNNEPMREQTKHHYIDATFNDIMAKVDKLALRRVVERLDAVMENNPSKELADISNFLQQLMEDDNATTASND